MANNNKSFCFYLEHFSLESKNVIKVIEIVRLRAIFLYEHVCTESCLELTRQQIRHPDSRVSRRLQRGSRPCPALCLILFQSETSAETGLSLAADSAMAFVMSQ